MCRALLILLFALMLSGSAHAQDGKLDAAGLKKLFDLKQKEAQLQVQKNHQDLINAKTPKEVNDLFGVIDKRGSGLNCPSLIGARAVALSRLSSVPKTIRDSIEAQALSSLSRTGVAIYKRGDALEPSDALELVIDLDTSLSIALSQGTELTTKHPVRLLIYQKCSIPRIPGSLVRANTYTVLEYASTGDNIADVIEKLVDTFVIDFLAVNSSR